MRSIRAAIAVVRCPSVRPSVTFVSSVKTGEHILEIFSPSGSQAILVLPHQKLRQYSDGNPPPNGGAKCKGYEKTQVSTNISLYLINHTRYDHSYYGMRIGNHLRSIDWCHFQ